MKLRFLCLALLAALLPAGVHAQPAGAVSAADAPVIRSLVGAWDLRIDGATIFRFEIAEAGDGEWSGAWLRPDTFNSDGNAFYNIRGRVKASPSMTGITFRDTVELAFDDPRPGAIPDIFRFRLTGEDSAEMIYVGTDLAPYALVRADAADPIGSWDATRFYRRAVPAGAAVAVAPAAPAPVAVRNAITFDLADPARVNPQAVRRIAPEPQPASVLPPVEEGPVTIPAPVATVEPKPTAAVPADPVEQPRIGYDFLDGL